MDNLQPRGGSSSSGHTNMDDNYYHWINNIMKDPPTKSFPGDATTTASRIKKLLTWKKNKTKGDIIDPSPLSKQNKYKFGSVSALSTGSLYRDVDSSLSYGLSFSSNDIKHASVRSVHSRSRAVVYPWETYKRPTPPVVETIPPDPLREVSSHTTCTCQKKTKNTFGTVTPKSNHQPKCNCFSSVRSTHGVFAGPPITPKRKSILPNKVDLCAVREENDRTDNYSRPPKKVDNQKVSGKRLSGTTTKSSLIKHLEKKDPHGSLASRKSILECDVSAYDLIKKYLKTGKPDSDLDDDLSDNVVEDESKNGNPTKKKTSRNHLKSQTNENSPSPTSSEGESGIYSQSSRIRVAGQGVKVFTSDQSQSSVYSDSSKTNSVDSRASTWSSASISDDGIYSLPEPDYDMEEDGEMNANTRRFKDLKLSYSPPLLKKSVGEDIPVKSSTKNSLIPIQQKETQRFSTVRRASSMITLTPRGTVEPAFLGQKAKNYNDTLKRNDVSKSQKYSLSGYKEPIKDGLGYKVSSPTIPVMENFNCDWSDDTDRTLIKVNDKVPNNQCSVTPSIPLLEVKSILKKASENDSSINGLLVSTFQELKDARKKKRVKFKSLSEESLATSNTPDENATSKDRILEIQEKAKPQPPIITKDFPKIQKTPEDGFQTVEEFLSSKKTESSLPERSSRVVENVKSTTRSSSCNSSPRRDLKTSSNVYHKPNNITRPSQPPPPPPPLPIKTKRTSNEHQENPNTVYRNLTNSKAQNSYFTSASPNVNNYHSVIKIAPNLSNGRSSLFSPYSLGKLEEVQEINGGEEEEIYQSPLLSNYEAPPSFSKNANSSPADSEHNSFCERGKTELKTANEILSPNPKIDGIRCIKSPDDISSHPTSISLRIPPNQVEANFEITSENPNSCQPYVNTPRPSSVVSVCNNSESNSDFEDRYQSIPRDDTAISVTSNIYDTIGSATKKYRKFRRQRPSPRRHSDLQLGLRSTGGITCTFIAKSAHDNQGRNSAYYTPTCLPKEPDYSSWDDPEEDMSPSEPPNYPPPPPPEPSPILSKRLEQSIPSSVTVGENTYGRIQSSCENVSPTKPTYWNGGGLNDEEEIYQDALETPMKEPLARFSDSIISSPAKANSSRGASIVTISITDKGLSDQVYNSESIYEEVSDVLSYPSDVNDSMNHKLKNSVLLPFDFPRKSFFEGASKAEILNYLEDAKERVVDQLADDGIEIMMMDEEDDETVAKTTTTIRNNRNRVSNISNSSESSATSDSSISHDDVIRENITFIKTGRTNAAEVERNDSGVGTETSKPLRLRRLDRPNNEEQLCADCDQQVEPLEGNMVGILLCPLVCRKCDKKRSERKEIITEIVETEFKYGRDLSIIKEEFYHPMEVAGLLSKEQLRGVFLNLDELAAVNDKFAEKLKDGVDIAVEQGDEDYTTVNIGKLFLENTAMLHAFESYLIRQGSASLLLSNLEKEKELLRIFLRVSQMENTLLRRMNLSAFLMVPVQRVTKYPLLLNRLYKVTPYHHQDREALREAQLKIELHLEHINQQTKGVGGTKIWRRISNISAAHRRIVNVSDIGSIKLRKMAIEVLKWSREEIRFVIAGKLLLGSIGEFSRSRRNKTIKFNMVHALLATLGKPNINYRPDLVTENVIFFPKNTGIRDASLLLVKEKNGRFVLGREPLHLGTCVIALDETSDEIIEIQEYNTKETIILKAECKSDTQEWLKQLRYHAKDLGSWRRRRNAMANIMINGMTR